ncbi:MAG: hypothetical protein K0Q87_430, partial [Neobacillus sp.]|nr:hypothetical protein [Neobacillus sp.]
FDESLEDWIGIPKKMITENELTLLKTLYELVEFPPPPLTSVTKEWYEFLFLDGEPPSTNPDSYFRMIQFHFSGDGIDQNEIEIALKGFFTEDIIIIWQNSNSGMVIEEKDKLSLNEQDLITMASTVESDFYVKISFYIGKFYPFSTQLGIEFSLEQKFYSFALKNLGQKNIFTFERIFPAYIASTLSDPTILKVYNQLADVFLEDQELYLTIKIFLENNLNASLTAKKLYIHRNTLQYRLDKFVEKTGIQLKDFYGAFTVFLACTLFEQENQPNTLPKKR